MSDIAIRVENLSKRYEIGRAGTRHDTLRDALAGLFRREGRGRSEAFWALRDVSFEVKRGEVVGIIGRNGAGKSTLLKVLSQITEPTGGRAEIHGRVGSLLEVGTGFHPELTGRENIYLNGAILGMRREEIARKFDEIVAFSEIEKFLDTPVKRYSSGMYVRLAFAVAAHLEPEILLVDEVLAVGDAAFQKKALGKMGDVVHEGRTVLFVSHNMAAVKALCGRTILLANGEVDMIGVGTDAIGRYLAADSQASDSPRLEDDNRLGFFVTRPMSLQAECGESITLEFAIESPVKIEDITAGLVVYDLYDSPVFGVSSKFQGVSSTRGNSKIWHVICDLGQIPLNTGTYSISIWLGNKYRDYAKFTKSISLNVVPADPFGWGSGVPTSWGYFYWSAKWNFITDEEYEGVVANFN